MKYLIDWIFATILTIGTLCWIFQEPQPFTLSKLKLRSLDGYPINSPKEKFILHLNTFNCQSCKRETQILMRYHIQHPNTPIVDANLILNEKQTKKIQKWKKKLDIDYTIASIEKTSPFSSRIPATFVIDPSTNQLLEIFGTLTYEKLLEATEKEK